jgi:OmpA-OmpF porin, OOP family
VVNYLSSHGITASRLIAKGYGETMLKNNCANGVNCTEAQHQENRRTELVVVN